MGLKGPKYDKMNISILYRKLMVEPVQCLEQLKLVCGVFLRASRSEMDVKILGDC